MESAKEASRQATDVVEDPLALILAELERPPRRKRTAWAYRLSLALVTVFVVALPLIYVAIVAATGWGTVWYALHAPRFVERLDSLWAILLIGAGPPIIGGILFFFLLKPLLARRERGEEPHILLPEKEPEIYDFVARLSEALDAPRPERIEVDLQVNASAAFASGLGSLFSGRLALRIGLPLVSGLSLREFTAILAHEFGHFSQGVGMRFYYLTASVNRWFARVVFGRDRWDDRLREWSEVNSLTGALVFNLARGCVGLSRKFLFLLMKIGRWASSLMSRQMEFDADQNAVRLCGTGAFVRSMELLPQIDAASRWANTVNNQTFRERRLADDYPALVSLGVEGMEAGVRRGIVEQSMDSTVDMYASHPPTGERVGRARKLDQDGVVTVGGPATVLFADYSALCREVTADVYRASLGRRFDPSLLVTPAEAIQAREGLERAAARSAEFFLDVELGPQALDFQSEVRAPKAPKEAFEALKRARRGVLQNLTDARFGAEKKRVCEERLAAALAARHLMSVNLPVLDETVTHLTSRASAGQLIREVRAERERCQERMAAFVVSLHERIQHTLSMLHVDQLRGSLEEPQALLDRGNRALRLLIDMKPGGENIAHLHRSLGVLIRLQPQLDGAPSEQVDKLVDALMKEFRTRMLQARAKLACVEHPFRSPAGEGDLAGVLFPAPPRPQENPGVTIQKAAFALEGWNALVNQAQSELADVCLQAEAAMNLRTLTPN